MRLSCRQQSGRTGEARSSSCLARSAARPPRDGRTAERERRQMRQVASAFPTRGVASCYMRWRRERRQPMPCGHRTRGKNALEQSCLSLSQIFSFCWRKCVPYCERLPRVRRVDHAGNGEIQTKRAEDSACASTESRNREQSIGVRNAPPVEIACIMAGKTVRLQPAWCARRHARRSQFPFAVSHGRKSGWAA